LRDREAQVQREREKEQRHEREKLKRKRRPMPTYSARPTNASVAGRSSLRNCSRYVPMECDIIPTLLDRVVRGDVVVFYCHSKVLWSKLRGYAT
jgi:hypothetical protein